MQHLLVMTVIGPDQPGLVENLAAIVEQNGGNWLESKMSRLGGCFAGILRVAIPEENREKTISALKLLEKQGLEVVVQSDQNTPEVSEFRYAALELVGQDRPGIVKNITKAIASQNINVEELETETTSGAMSGELMFHARARLGVPPTCDIGSLHETLEKIAADLIVELTFEELAAEEKSH